MSTDPRPGLADRVRLRVGEQDTLARVVAVEAGVVRLEGELGATGDAEMVFSHPRGVIALAGGLAHGEGGELVFTVTEQRRLEQRRAAFRLAVAVPLVVTRMSGERLEARSGDVSISGVRILEAAELDLDEHVEVAMDLGELDTVALSGSVVRRDGDSRAVAFTAVPVWAEEQLARFLADEQRRRLLGA
jgi:hypothetical protein